MGSLFRIRLILISGLLFIVIGVEVGFCEETPGDVAARFVEAIDEGNYEEVLKHVYRPWIHDDWEILVDNLWLESREERESTARGFGANSFSDFAMVPTDEFLVLWAQGQWPFLLPPAQLPLSPQSPHGFCGTADQANRAKKMAELRSGLVVWVVEEKIVSDSRALVSIEAWYPVAFEGVDIELSLMKTSGGSWRIDGTESWVAPD